MPLVTLVSFFSRIASSHHLCSEMTSNGLAASSEIQVGTN